MNGISFFSHTRESAPGRFAFPEVAPYLSERGFAVLQYDKRGTNGVNNTSSQGQN